MGQFAVALILMERCFNHMGLGSVSTPKVGSRSSVKASAGREHKAFVTTLVLHWCRFVSP